MTTRNEIDKAVEQTETGGWKVEAVLLGAHAMMQLVKECRVGDVMFDPRQPHKITEYKGRPVVLTGGAPGRIELLMRHDSMFQGQITTVRP